MIHFEDRHPEFDTKSPYLITNEEPDLFNQMLPTPAMQAASISSGGEVLLMTVLTHTIGRVYAVDHCCESLASAIGKCLVIQQLGPEAAKAMFSTNKANQALESIRPLLPGPLRDIAHWPDDNAMAREWRYATEQQMAIIAGGLNRLTFIHGDFTDLSQDGFFDLLYLSNMLEHGSRSGITDRARLTSNMVGLGGIALTTGNAPLPQMVKGDGRSGTRTHWKYELWRKAQ